MEALIGLDALGVVERPIKRDGVELGGQEAGNDGLYEHPPASIAHEKSLQQANPLGLESMQALEVEDVGAD